MGNSIIKRAVAKFMKNTVTLKKNYEFLRVYKKGKFYVGRIIILYILENNQGMNRMGITASRKYGKSVKRNRLRRLIKESYSSMEDLLKVGYNFVFVARNNEIELDFFNVKKEMKFLFKKLNVLDNSKCDIL